jgi:hypothetical protein
MSTPLKTALLATLGILTATAASAAPASCAMSPEQQSAFDVGALKSELTVVAVTCNDDELYNAFVQLHRNELVAEDGAVNGWFRRVYGRLAQPRYDAYITLLANDQAEIGQKEGSDFCPRLKLMFPEVMAVPSASLAQYAAAKDLEPAGLTPCEVAAEPAAAPAKAGRRPAKPHK